MNGQSYDSFAEAAKNAVPENGVVTYTINGKVTISNTTSNNWYEELLFNNAEHASDLSAIHVKGDGSTSQVDIADDLSVFALRLSQAIDVSFEGLTLSRSNYAYRNGAAHSTKFFTTWVSGGSVTYTNCVFPNGSHSNWYGSTSYDKCTFINTNTSINYGLWVSTDQNSSRSTTVSDCTFNGNRGIKVYYETGYPAPTLNLSNTTFNGLAETNSSYGAITIAKPANVTMQNVTAKNCKSANLLTKKFDDNVAYESLNIPSGANVSGELSLQSKDNKDAETCAIAAGTFDSAIDGKYCAPGYEVKENSNGTWGVEQKASYAAKDKNGNEYATLEAALAAVTPDNPLSEVSESAWPEATPVYYDNGNPEISNFYGAESGDFFPKSALGKAFEDANTANSNDVAKIYIRPNFQGGSDQPNRLACGGNSHQDVISTSIAIYGNGASLNQKWQPIAEWSDGSQTWSLNKDISVEMYNLNNGAALWGTRTSAHTISLTMQNCQNVHQAFLQQGGTAETRNNFTIKNCTFAQQTYSDACPITTNNAGDIVIEGCTFSGYSDNYVINVNNKVGGETNVNVSGTSFEGCGAVGKEPVRLTGEASGSSVNGTLSKLTFESLPENVNGVIIGNSNSAKNNAKVSYTVTGTDVTANVYKQGVAAPETVTTTKTQTATGKNFEQVFVAEVNDIQYETLQEAIDAAQYGQTIKLIGDVQTADKLLIDKTIVLDLNGKTIANSWNGNGYSLINYAPLTLKNGTYRSTGSSARGIDSEADVMIENATIEAAGLVGFACGNANGKHEVRNSTVKGGYAIADFADGTTLTLSGSSLVGTWCGLYHNGTNSGFTLKASGTSIIAGSEERVESNNETTAVLISGSTKTVEAAGLHNVSFSKCTVKGGTGIEVKYADLTLESCAVEATATKSSYTPNNNGGTSVGFAVVSTDNTNTTTMAPAPQGTVTITGSASSINGYVGLSGFPSAAERFGDFADANYSISGGTFSNEVPADYCADGYVPAKDEATDTYGVTIDTASGWYDVAPYRSGDTYSVPEAPTPDLVFAGWYADDEYQIPLVEGVTTGVAHAKFVEISDLITFKGGSLRMDQAADKGTSLRFGYVTKAPANCRFVESGWDWRFNGVEQDYVKTKNRVLFGDGSAMANLVITKMTVSQYEPVAEVREHLVYKTADGTQVEAVEANFNKRSVYGVAESIRDNLGASQEEWDYAMAILRTKGQ